MRLNQIQVNLIQEIHSMQVKLAMAAETILVGVDERDILQASADDALMVSLHLREYLRPKSIVEKKGQRG